MATKYTEQQLEKAFENLPGELQEAIFSLDTSEVLWQSCEKHGVVDKRYGEIGKRIGYVLMGLMLPQEFDQALQKEIRLPEKVAQDITREINRFVFYPVKSALEQLHQIEIEVTAKVVTSKPEEDTKQEQPPEKPSVPDAYREPVE